VVILSLLNKKAEKLRCMKKTIVVAEDNDMLNRVLEYRLKNDGYDAKIFVNGVDAVDWMKSNPFDLLITDLYMPMMNGMELIQLIQEKISVAIPIMVISASHEEDMVNRLFKMGVSDFISKPFRPGELSLRVKRLLELNQVQNRNEVLPGINKNGRKLSH